MIPIEKFHYLARFVSGKSNNLFKTITLKEVILEIFNCLQGTYRWYDCKPFLIYTYLDSHLITIPLT